MMPAAIQPSPVNADTLSTRPRMRLEFLDGLRGLAALYVVLGHTSGDNIASLPPNARWAFSWMDYARLAVDVFIVLSGFCLMLPVVRSTEGQLRGGAAAYLKRRAWRILPPYYAALALSLAFLLLSRTGLRFMEGHVDADMALTFAPGNLLTHLFLVHNLRSIYSMSINGPLWSVATEWQIYFVFPLLLLPLWRRFGIAAAVAGGFCIGLLPHFLLPMGRNFDWACPWYIGLFALGMLGAEIGFGRAPHLERVRRVLPWGPLSFVLSIGACGFISLRPHFYYQRAGFVGDTLAGLAAISLIIYCAGYATRETATRPPLILRLLEARWVVFLGSFSYSLYLTHRIAMLKLYPILQVARLTPVVERVVIITVCIPVVLVFAYVFHRVCERPFMSGRLRVGQSRAVEEVPTAAKSS